MKLLDLMAKYKLNKLHLHLTDDEGWRIEVPQLPELTQVNKRREREGGVNANIIKVYSQTLNI